MFGLAFIASVVLLVSVALKSLVTCSALATKFWLVAGEVYDACVHVKYCSYYLTQSYPF